METVVLVRNALRLVLRHWPTLLAVIFAGYIARQVFVRLAVYASDGHRVLGMLVFALVPMGFLIAIVLALRAVRSLLPFLVVYASVDFFTDPSAVLQRSQERLPYTLGEVAYGGGFGGAGPLPDRHVAQGPAQDAGEVAQRLPGGGVDDAGAGDVQQRASGDRHEAIGRLLSVPRRATDPPTTAGAAGTLPAARWR
jgi:hypothetical protein